MHIEADHGKNGLTYDEALLHEEQGGFDSLISQGQWNNAFARGRTAYERQHNTVLEAKEENTAKLSDELFEDADNSKGDTLDDSSIVLEKDESSYPYDEKTVIDGYEKAVDNRIIDFINRVRGIKDDSRKKKQYLILSDVKSNSKLSKDIKRLTGLTVDGFKNRLDGNDLLHIEADHGKNGKSDRSMSNDNDLARIRFVIDNYDSIDVVTDSDGNVDTDYEHQNYDQTPSVMVKLSKKINGTYYVVEAVSNAEAKKVYVKSAYISKKNGSTSEMLNMPENEPAAYVRKSPVQSDTTTNNSISLSEEDVKSFLDGVGSYGKTVYNRIVDDVVKKAVDSGESLTAAKKGVLEAFAHIYKSGMDGKAISKKYVDTYFSRSQVNEIYDAGKRDAESRSNVARKKNARLIKDQALTKAKISSREVKMLEALAKLCGRDIRFSESLHGNAKINLNTGDIIISTHAKNGARWAAVHEVFHALRIDNPAEANRLIRVVCDILERNNGLFDAVKKKYTQVYLSDILDSDGNFKENCADIIKEEIAADMIGYVISHSEVLSTITGEQRNALEKFIDRLTSHFSRNDKYLSKLSPELRRAFREVYKEIDVISEQFKAAIEKQREVVKEKGVEVERDEKKTSGEEVKKSRDLSGDNVDRAFKPSEKVTLSFSNAIDKWLSGSLKSSEQFELGETPTILQKLNAQNFPIKMSQEVLVKITGGKHSISLDEIKRLPEAIHDPIMVFDSASVPNAFVIFTELTDKSGNDVVVAIHLNRKAGFNYINRIASVYGKDNIGSFIENQISANNLRYIEKKKSQDWLRSRGLQLPKLNTILNSNNNILQKEDIVNSFLMESDERFDSGKSDIRWSRDLSEELNETVRSFGIKDINDAVNVQ